MLHVDPHAAPRLITLAGLALGKTQGELAALLGVSKRTISRFACRHSTPDVTQMQRLARHVHPHDAALAADIADACSSTLEGWGIVTPAPPAPSPPHPEPPPAAPPPPPARPSPFAADAIVCAAAEALATTPQAVRGAVVAAFRRAQAIGYTLDEAVTALDGNPPPPKRRK